ncbi:MAG: acyl-CoA dehydrogenase family protein [Fuerstiella sp.]
MDFDWTKEQATFRSKLSSFASESLQDDVVARDHESKFSEDLWQQCSSFGILKWNVPEQFGGSVPIDVLTAVGGMERLGFECRDQGLLLALNTQLWSVQSPIVELGTDAQKAFFLPKLSSGQWKGAHAMTEPGAGSDAYGIQTTAIKERSGYRLTGQKIMITLAPLADVFLVTAVTDPTKGRWGLSTFIVQKTAPGCHVSAADQKMGLRTVPFGRIEFKDCYVEESARLGAEGSDITSIQTLLEVERCCILASQIGAMNRQLDTCIEFSRKRRQFGKPIASFQSVSNRVADMKVRLETARMLLYRVAWLKSQNKSAVTEAAVLKLYLSEAFVESSMDAMRIHGGRGYMTEPGIERDLRDAMGGVFYAGTSDIQRNIIAGMMGVTS